MPHIILQNMWYIGFIVREITSVQCTVMASRLYRDPGNENVKDQIVFEHNYYNDDSDYETYIPESPIRLVVKMTVSQYTII
jgi:hypothetical protein